MNQTTVDLLKMSAFAAEPGGGNPAGVVLDATGLTAEQMHQIAADLGYPETAFVSGRSDSEGSRRYRIQYWSPEAEVPFCGHATVATATALAQRDGAGSMVFETQAGDVAVETTATAGEVSVAMTSVVPQVRELSEQTLDELLGILGLELADIDPQFPPRESFAGNWHPVIVLKDREVFNQFRYSPAAIAAIKDEQGWTGTVTILHEVATLEFSARNIFPVGRINEDPATGSAAASTGAYLREIGYAPAGSTITIRQGAHVGRPSLLLATIPATGGIIVTGSASLIS